MIFKKRETTRDILRGRDQEYSTFTSEKAMVAREIAMTCEYFLPYFEVPNMSEKSNVLGLLFNNEVIWSNYKLSK